MVYSLFKAKKFIKKNEDLVICYSDIIFSHQIYDLFEKNKKTFIPVKKNWLILLELNIALLPIMEQML